MRPMRFPRRFPWLIALVLLPFSGVLSLPLGLWYWLAYSPVQHYYLGAYFESASWATTPPWRSQSSGCRAGVAGVAGGPSCLDPIK